MRMSMSELITIVSLIAGVIILSITFYKYARSDLKDIAPWHSGAVSLTGLALLGFGLFNEISVQFSEDQSITLKKFEQLEDKVTRVAEAATSAAEQSLQATQQVTRLKDTVDERVEAIETSVAQSFSAPAIAKLNTRMVELDAIRTQVDRISADLQRQSEAIADLSSRLARTDAKLQTLQPGPGRLPEGTVGVVYFGLGGTKLSDQALETLKRIATTVKPMEGKRIVVTGHADSSGSPRVNQALAQQRAAVVADRLVAFGLPESRIVVEGVGASDPAVPTPEGTRETFNRRVVIRVE